MQLVDNRHFSVLDNLSTFCALGVRFWDATTDSQIRDGLQVKLWPRDNINKTVTARRTISDIYAFHKIPGLLELENLIYGSNTIDSPEMGRVYVLEVIDLEDRFLPSAVSLTLPLDEVGLLLNYSPSSPTMDAPGYYLFPSSTRSNPPNIAVVRGELVDSSTGRGAAHAVIQVDIPGEPRIFTIADASGVFAAHFPYPRLPGSLAPLDASPPGPIGPPISDRQWSLAISVFYTGQSDGTVNLPGTDYPNIRALFQQPPALIHTALDSPTSIATEWLGTLNLNKEVIVRTENQSTLTVEPLMSPV